MANSYQSYPSYVNQPSTEPLDLNGRDILADEDGDSKLDIEDNEFTFVCASEPIASITQSGLNMFQHQVFNSPLPVASGDLCNKAYVDSAIPGLVELFLSNSTSADVAGYLLAAATNDSGQTEKQTLGSSAAAAIEEWVSAASSPGITRLSAGQLSVQLYAAVDAAGTTSRLYSLSASFFIRAASGVETQIGATVETDYLTTDVTLYELTIQNTESFELATTDRFVVKIAYERLSGGLRVTDRTISLFLGSTTPSHLNTPVTTAILGQYLRLDGSLPMTGNLDTNGYDLILDVDADTYWHSPADDILDAVASGITMFSVDGVEGRVVSNRQIYSPEANTLTPTGTSVSVDLSNSNTVTIDLGSATGDVTVHFAHPKAGSSYAVRVIQGNPSRLVTWVNGEGSCAWESQTPMVLSTTEDAEDVVFLTCFGTTLYLMGGTNFG